MKYSEEKVGIMLNSVIYSPREDYENKLMGTHLRETEAFFNGLVSKSGVDIEADRKIVVQQEFLLPRQRKSRKMQKVFFLKFDTVF